MDPYAQALGLPTAPSGLPPNAGVLSSADQAHSDAYESDPSVAAELKKAIARATPAQRAILLNPQANGTALVKTPAKADPYADALGLNGAPTPSPKEAAPAPQSARMSFGPFDDLSNFGARMGANLGNSVYGGLKGLGTLVTGGGIDAAAEATRSAPIPVVAPTLATQQMEKGLGYVQAPFDMAGDWAQRGTEESGVAGGGVMGAISKAGLSNLPLLLGVGPRTARTAALEDGAAAVKAPTLAPGDVPTLAHASPELQQAVAAAGAKANPAVIARHVEADTLPVPGKMTEGQATQDAATISREMNGRGKEKPSVSPQFYQQQGQTVAANMDAIRSTAAPDIPTSASIVDYGQTLLDAYKAKDASVTADISSKYKALADANGGSLPVSGTDFVTSADAALAKQMKGRYVPKEIAADMEAFRQGGPMTFEDFENMRSNLAAEGRKAERAGDGNAAGAINIVRNSLESLPITGETAAIKPLADAARSAAKARFDAIKADPAYKAAVNDPTEMGQPSPAADRFFNSYVRDGARENVARMQTNLQDSPQASQTIAAGVLDHLRGQLKADPVTGNFSSANYNKALNTLAPKLGNLVDPATAQQLQAVGGYAKNVQTQPRGSYVNNSNTAVELAAQGTKAALEHGTNVLFGGIPVGTVGRKVGAAVSDVVRGRNAADQALKPGAGLTRLSDMTK